MNKPEVYMKKDIDIIQKAIDAAPVRPGLSFGQFCPIADRGRGVPDGLLTISHRRCNQTFAVVVKTHLHHAMIERLIADCQRTDSNQPLLIITDQIADTHAVMLMNADVAFMDSAGNVSLNLPELSFTMTGRRTPDPIQKPLPGRAFQPSGLKLVFALLTDPFVTDPSKAFINQPFRVINQQTGVALGSIGWILRDLEDAGYLVRDNKMRLLVDRSNLFQKWVASYADRLRPKQDRRRYRASSPDWWQSVSLNVPSQLWGGEPAAAKLTGFLKPQIITLYSRSQPNDLILDSGLRLDADGDVEVVDMFWNDWVHAAHQDCTHPMLVYADLLASDIDRNTETASRVYDEYLRKTIESD